MDWVTRRQIRRLVLARMSGETTPPGRWVASTRWMPRERPRWARPTSPRTKSGSSSTSVANSSIDDDQPAQRRRSASRRRRPQRLDVLDAVRRQDPFAAAQLGGQRRQRALGEPAVEVGDQADGVRQPGAVAKGRAALVVDEDEGQGVRPVGERRARRPGSAAARSCRRRWCRRSGRAGRRRDRSTEQRPVGSHADHGLGRTHRAACHAAAIASALGVARPDQVEQPGARRAARRRHRSRRRRR